MSEIPANKPAGGGATPRTPSPLDNPNNIVLGRKKGITLLNHDYLDVLLRLPLPGLVIFVHGVNSDGEWYTETEKGLCAGLNDRLKRRDEHMAYPTPEGGQLTPATYEAELTPDGHISPNMQADTFMKDDDHFTPVIHFRWGYKASPVELQTYGDSIYLNEEDYWGGGPFANGCTALPDLWSEGLSDNLFLWMHVQHLNPTKDRNVYSCPPRPYYVLAALRLAKLIESIRRKQADVPITIVCHSQGNMIGMAAAFLGDRMPTVTDAAGVQGRCVADTYVLCNAPYSLLGANSAEDWTEGHMKDKHGGTGRQTERARIGTLRAFFDIIRQPASREQKVEDINQFMENENHGFDAGKDRMQYGYGVAPSTCRRVTLYCNPHDEVISSTSVQGIGWRGLSQAEIDATGGTGIFCQRVFAQKYKVGEKGQYHYWHNHYMQPKPGSQGYWHPESLTAQYSLSKGLDANRGKFFGSVLSMFTAPFAIVALELAAVRINALPHKDWTIPLDAPQLPEPFEPKALRFGAVSDQFDQAYDAPGQSRDSKRVREADDPYAGDRPLPKQIARETGDTTDAAKGNADSEAAMRYEDHARLRMQAKREGLVKKGEKVIGEDKPGEAGAKYKAWHNKKIKTYLAKNIDTHATDHSTIMTNGMHAEKALAYDVAIGLCHILDKDLHKLRIAADWRFLDGLANDDRNKVFLEYFKFGKYRRVPPDEWVRTHSKEGGMPDKIIDQREHPAPNAPTYPGGHP
jgi:pimeloyl-ACP methyl ester carboxylesterase